MTLHGQTIRTEVDGAIEEFRDIFNDLSRIAGEMFDNSRRWNTVCSAMDVIQNNEAAIKAYEASPNPSDLGGVYLMVYGLFQSLLVQQESLGNLFKEIGATFIEWNNPELEKVRDLRNDCIGHPTSRTRHDEPRSNFFYSPNWSKDHFAITRAYHNEDCPDDSQEIYPPELICDQRKAIASAIKRATNFLKKMENDHRKQFRSIRLQASLNGYVYFFEKLFSHFHLSDNSNNFSLAMRAQKTLCENFSKFENDLMARNLKGKLPGLDVAIEDIRTPMDCLNRYFAGTSSFDAREAKSFAVHFESRFKDIHLMAGEIDEEYQTDL
jgi:hypothetical protein